MILHQWWIIPKSLTIILTDKSDMVAHGKVFQMLTPIALWIMNLTNSKICK